MLSNKLRDKKNSTSENFSLTFCKILKKSCFLSFFCTCWFTVCFLIFLNFSFRSFIYCQRLCQVLASHSHCVPRSYCFALCSRTKYFSQTWGSKKKKHNFRLRLFRKSLKSYLPDVGSQRAVLQLFCSTRIQSKPQNTSLLASFIFEIHCVKVGHPRMPKNS